MAVEINETSYSVVSPYDGVLSMLATGNTSIRGAAISTTTETPDNFLPKERLIEGLYLMMLACSGISLNALIALCVIMTKFQSCNGFLLHACLLDAFKSALCIPYALYVLEIIDTPPYYCNPLGLAYVIALTVSMFNLLAIVMSEAFAFHEKNVNYPDEKGSSIAMCCAFGIATIYIGSVILHLGPTLIGGEFKFNEDIGNCLFAYGKVQNYIVQVIWVIIVTLTVIVIFRYIYKFYRQLKANQRFRISNLARNAAAYSKGKAPDENIYETVSRLKRRVRVLLCMAAVYCACWYPLFFLTLLDYKYTQPRYLYRILTIIAWSHSALIPITMLAMDRTFGLIAICKRAASRTYRVKGSKTMSPSTQPLTRDDSTFHGGSQHTSLYNHTMNTSGKSVAFSDKSKTKKRNGKNNKAKTPPPSVVVVNNGRDEITKLSDSDSPQSDGQVPPTLHPAVIGLLSDYDSLSLEESPL